MSSNFNQPSSNTGHQEPQSGSRMRESMAGQDVDSSTSGFAGHNPSSEPGRDTSFASSQTMDSMRSSNLGPGMAGTGASSGMGTRINPATYTYSSVGTTEVGPQEFTVTTGINSGAGVHAQQYQGSNVNLDPAGVNATAVPGSHHHHGAVHAHHAGVFGDCQHPECAGHHSETGSHSDCAACMSSSGAYASPLTGTGTSVACEHHSGIGQHAGPHHVGPRSATGLMGGSGGTTAPAMGGMTATGMPPGTRESTVDQNIGQTSGSSGGMGVTGKPTMTDKIVGGAEKMAGKVIGNQTMEIQGQERKTGELNKNV